MNYIGTTSSGYIPLISAKEESEPVAARCLYLNQKPYGFPGKSQLKMSYPMLLSSTESHSISRCFSGKSLSLLVS